MGAAARSVFAAPVDDRLGMRGNAHRVVGSIERSVAAGLVRMQWYFAILLLLMAGFAGAEPTSAPSDDRMDFGTELLVFPPIVFTNPLTARTAELIGQAYRHQDPIVWKRVQYVADLGQTARPEAAPFLVDAMKDPAPAVRAEAARSAAQVVDAPNLLAEVEKLLADTDASVRREA